MKMWCGGGGLWFGESVDYGLESPACLNIENVWNISRYV